MKFLRRVKGRTRRDIKNENIRQKLNIYNINDKIRQYLKVCFISEFILK